MPRVHVVVRAADQSMVDEVAVLLSAHRREARAADPLSPSEAALRVSALVARDDVQVLIARSDERPVGYAVIVESAASTLTDTPVSVIEHLFVDGTTRRRGVARALLTAALAHAERTGAEQIVTNVPSSVRDANRFFARLGFTPTVVRRVTTPAALRRKLAGSEPRSDTRTSVEQLLLRRRAMRRRATVPTSIEATGSALVP